MLIVSIILSLRWVFIISLNKYLVSQIKSTLKYLYFVIINGIVFIGFSVDLWDIRMPCNWFFCGFILHPTNQMNSFFLFSKHVAAFLVFFRHSISSADISCLPFFAFFWVAFIYQWTVCDERLVCARHRVRLCFFNYSCCVWKMKSLVYLLWQMYWEQRPEDQKESHHVPNALRFWSGFKHH